MEGLHFQPDYLYRELSNRNVMNEASIPEHPTQMSTIPMISCTCDSSGGTFSGEPVPVVEVDEAAVEELVAGLVVAAAIKPVSNCRFSGESALKLAIELPCKE